jgi:diguanylate cyclase (GGDEF)-like protein
VVELRCLRQVRGQTRVRLEKLTFVDPLTGVYNYRYLRQRLGEEFARAKRYGEPLSVIYLDFDHFKELNDTFGHEAGNRVLVRIASQIRASSRSEDFVGRLGGDEFLIVLPRTDPDAARFVAERLKGALASVKLDAGPGKRIDFLTFSMGVAGYPAHVASRAELLRVADEALYRAKRQGGDRVLLADSA